MDVNKLWGTNHRMVICELLTQVPEIEWRCWARGGEMGSLEMGIT